MDILSGAVRHYAWGSTTFIPELLGCPADHLPHAELWLGAHPGASSRVSDEPLDELITQDPVGVVGATVVRRFGARLPYLMKVLAAEKPLSLQVHPDRAQAEAGYRREQWTSTPDRLYSDDWPKPEMLCALTRVDALSGFREPRATYRLFAAIGAPGALKVVEPLIQDDPDPVRLALARILHLGETARPILDELVDQCRQISGVHPDLQEFCRTVIEIGRAHPGDPGLLAALLMNRVTCEPGDALYVPSGTIHAYLSGAGIEIMANSDNVLRGGLTKKTIAVDELLAVLDTSASRPHVVRPHPEGGGVDRYRTPAPEFCLWRISLSPTPTHFPHSDVGRIALLTDGRAEIIDNSGRHRLKRGESVFLYPGEEVHTKGSGTLYVAGPGDHH